MLLSDQLPHPPPRRPFKMRSSKKEKEDQVSPLPRNVPPCYSLGVLPQPRALLVFPPLPPQDSRTEEDAGDGGENLGDKVTLSQHREMHS